MQHGKLLAVTFRSLKTGTIERSPRTPAANCYAMCDLLITIHKHATFAIFHPSSVNVQSRMGVPMTTLQAFAWNNGRLESDGSASRMVFSSRVTKNVGLVRSQRRSARSTKLRSRSGQIRLRAAATWPGGNELLAEFQSLWSWCCRRRRWTLDQSPFARPIECSPSAPLIHRAATSTMQINIGIVFWPQR